MKVPRTPSSNLKGKRALVTGGSRGLGFGAAAALAEAGAETVVLARNGDQVTEAVEALLKAGFDVWGMPLDITDSSAVSEFVGSQKPFDILVNSAGLARHTSFLEASALDFDAVMDINVRAAFFLAQAVAKKLIEAKRPGSIITVSSQMGHVGGPKRAVYCASKWAVEGMTKALALELGAHRIRVNTVCPTFVQTELTAKGLADPQFRSWVLSKIALGRLAEVEDLMGPILFLASDQSAMVTGSALMVDGGWTAE
jgi:NAD(P)-dependent dehydrogenase (short-subunit alcohol dehydrogenase family)